MRLKAYGKTDVGLQRSNNEDSFYIDEQRGLFIVADGMGGHAAGEIASAMAISVVREILEPEFDQQYSADHWQSLLAEAINRADRAIIEAAAENPAWNGMGTTLTVLLIQADRLLLGHVGDSRLYRWRSQQLEQLSEDHTLVAEQLRRGILDQQQADSSNLRNILLQAVGLGEDLDICLKNLTVAAGDRLLLSSDGLTDMLSEEQISAILTETRDADQGCAELLSAALEAGGKDNVTTVLIEVERS